MLFIAVLTRNDGFAPDAFAQELPSEIKRATELYAGGIFRQLYTRQDGRGAVIHIEATDKEEAESALFSLPMVAKRMLDFELHAVGAYRGFIASAAKS